MITIAGLTFSILIVALQLASSQFGPRVLRNYMRDRGSQFVLGTFIATFLYCLMVMRTIGDVEGDEPRLAVTLAVVLAVGSLAVLIYFLHHSAASVHAPNVITTIAHELDHAIERLYPTSVGAPGDDVTMPAQQGAGEVPLETPHSGYVQRIDGAALLELAMAHDVVIRVLRRPGDFVVADHPLAAMSPADRLSETIRRETLRAFILGEQRTAEQDIEFCFEQLVQIALRALSPAYNDPLTAAACIERIGAAFERLLQRREPPAVRVDHTGQARVIAEPTSTARLIDLVVAPIIESARGNSIVLRQLARTLLALSARAGEPGARSALSACLEMLRQQSDSLISPHARAAVQEAHLHARSRLARALH
jgi:uncharacterized membrane protein